METQPASALPFHAVAWRQEVEDEQAHMRRLPRAASNLNRAGEASTLAAGPPAVCEVCKGPLELAAEGVVTPFLHRKPLDAPDPGEIFLALGTPLWADSGLACYWPIARGRLVWNGQYLVWGTRTNAPAPIIDTCLCMEDAAETLWAHWDPNSLKLGPLFAALKRRIEVGRREGFEVFA